MSSRLNPYINFDGDARQALEFYQGIFGGTVALNTFGEFGNDEPSIANKIMHGQLETAQGYTIMVSDLPPGQELSEGGNVTLSLSGEDDDLRGYWDQLSAGGSVDVPLEKQMWGDEFGQCTDRFGVSWMVNIGQPKA